MVLNYIVTTQGCCIFYFMQLALRRKRIKEEKTEEREGKEWKEQLPMPTQSVGGKSRTDQDLTPRVTFIPVHWS